MQLLHCPVDETGIQLPCIHELTKQQPEQGDSLIADWWQQNEITVGTGWSSGLTC